MVFYLHDMFYKNFSGFKTISQDSIVFKYLPELDSEVSYSTVYNTNGSSCCSLIAYSDIKYDVLVTLP